VKFHSTGDVHIIMPKTALQTIFDACDGFDQDETGGRVVGTYDEHRGKLVVHVTGIIEAGPQARRSAVSFFQDGEYQERVFRHIENSHREIEHLGNWHTHHVNGLQTLSGGDLETYYRTVNHPNHNTPFFYAMLVTAKHKTSNPLRRYTIKHYMFRRGEERVYEIPSRHVEIVNRPLLWPLESEHHPSSHSLSHGVPVEHDRAHDSNITGESDTGPSVVAIAASTGATTASTRQDLPRKKGVSMDVFTLYVGQGSLAAVRAGNEAIIVDAHMPDCDEITSPQIEKSLDVYLAKSKVRGLILTGLDRDHACPAGVEYILMKYEPEWVMYPKYYKDTDAAGEVFDIITRHEKRREETSNPLLRKSVRVDRVDSRQLTGLATNFTFELFSPHMDDMDCSNNSSIVLKLTGLDPKGFSYLITGDTEKERWDSINRFFGKYLASDVMAASHHGGRSGLDPASLVAVNPNTVLISAGVDNSYGHPDGSAVKVYASVARHVFSTTAEGGMCLLTRRLGDDYDTHLVQHFALEPAKTT
jgi:integrative and conjugative element protein (TIGR02256 family)